MPSVIIQGDGIAARCCERLFAATPEWQICRDAAPRPRLPAIMVSESTQRMFADVFGEPDLFCGMPPITKRKVAWGDGAPLQVLPHSAVVADESLLLARLGSCAIDAAHPASDAWTIAAAKPLPPEAQERHFGSRVAHAVPLQLRPNADPQACLIESLSQGWLFLVPQLNASAWLLSVGGDAEALLGESRFVAREVLRLNGPGARFASHPRVAWPLCGDRWLACGTGALAFDPLCGDGCGNAIREAILAAAVVRAAHEGSDPDLLARHYRTRLLAGFQRHLEACAQFYQNGGHSPWWANQLAGIQAGLQWCRAELGAELHFNFRLNGFALEPVGTV